MFYVNCFLLYSILGYLLETIAAFVTKSHFKSGILFGPWTPVYGLGAVLIIFISHYFFVQLHLPRWKETIIVFIIITAVLTLLEWIGGVGIEFLFKKVFWDYSDDPTSIGHYISIRMSLIWGVGSIIFIYVIYPFLKNFIKHIPMYVTIPIFLLFIFDVVYTIITKEKIT